MVKIASGILAGALCFVASLGTVRAGTADFGVGSDSIRGSVTIDDDVHFGIRLRF